MSPAVGHRFPGVAVVAATVVLAATGCGGATGPVAVGSGPADGLVPIGAGLRGLPTLRATVYSKGLPAVSALALDSQGRLWVTTAAYKDQGNDALFLVDAPGSTPLQVVEGLPTPLGLVWSGDVLYVASTGRVDAYGGWLGTRFAKHDTIATWPASAGESNNLVQAPDGHLLVGVSAPCDHCTPTSHLSAAILSFRLDGSDLRVYAAGIRAPVGLAYYPGTAELLVTMNQRDDLGSRTPGDWLAIVREGQDWGFPGCYGQGVAACAGVPKPLAVLDKHAAVGGVAIVTSQLGCGGRSSHPARTPAPCWRPPLSSPSGRRERSSASRWLAWDPPTPVRSGRS